MSKWYRTGTVDVTNASAIVTGNTTYWQSAVDKPESGDIFLMGNEVYEIVSIEGDGSLTLDAPYTGSTLAAQPYRIIKLVSQNGMTRVAGQVSEVLNTLGERVTVSSAAPSSEQGNNGDIWIVVV